MTALPSRPVALVFSALPVKINPGGALAQTATSIGCTC